MEAKEYDQELIDDIYDLSEGISSTICDLIEIVRKSMILERFTEPKDLNNYHNNG